MSQISQIKILVTAKKPFFVYHNRYLADMSETNMMKLNLSLIKGHLLANNFSVLIDEVNVSYHFAANPVKFDSIFSILYAF